MALPFREEARAGARRPCHRLLFGLDSQVALGAAVKGRSSSPPLNDLLSRSIAPYVGFHIVPHLVFFPTEVNPADAPTRHQTVAAPADPAPLWWTELCGGRVAELDKITRASGFSADGEGFCQEELLELGGSPGPILQSGASLKRAAFLGPVRLQGEVLDSRRPCPPADLHSASVGANDLACLSSFPLRQFVCKGRLPTCSVEPAVSRGLSFGTAAPGAYFRLAALCVRGPDRLSSSPVSFGSG